MQVEENLNKHSTNTLRKLRRDHISEAIGNHAIIDIVDFRSTALLFVFYLSHLFFSLLD